MPSPNFNRSVFINCPFDEDYAPLLEAMLFCTVYLGFTPFVANLRLEGGENRQDKIVGMIMSCQYSVHDLSLCQVTSTDEFFRMNMPFEYGIDVGLRRSGIRNFSTKKFLIFEKNKYDLKKSLSDASGQDPEYHGGDYKRAVRAIRDFFYAEAGVPAPGVARIVSDYEGFQGWMVEKKIHEGHSEQEAIDLPTRERLNEMTRWNELERPIEFRLG